ncbi:MAG TPA: FGGY family carbohydrate kinase [Actinomycetes bacterium]|nr:FGGY family carbohydrate kinase [Actinomycetes bacterium]
MVEGRVVALDLGTSSVRALVFDEHGAAVPGVLARRATRLEVGDDGKAELDPDQVVAAVGDCLDELAGQGHLDAVEYVATSCAWHSVIALDAAGRRLTGALTWADTRAAPLVDELRRRVADLDRLHQATGALPHALYWTVKLPWLAAQSTPAPAAYLGLAEYVTGALLGDPSASPSMASGTGLLDLAAVDWHPEALELAGVDKAALPALARHGRPGRLGPEGARRWPALAGAAWHPVTGDGAASNVGASCVTPAYANINIGTSAAIRAVHRPEESGPLHPDLWRYLVDGRRLVTGAAYSGGGNLYAWLRGALTLPDPARVEAELATVPPGSRGVVVMPYHAGSRPPLDLTAGSGTIAGISLATTPVEILAATLEAVCYRLAAGYEALAAALPAEPDVVASGGAAVASPWGQQTLADVLGRPVRVVDEPEASARGAALLALGLTTEPATLRVVEPRPGAVEAQRAGRAAHEDLARRLGYTPAATATDRGGRP